MSQQATEPNACNVEEEEKYGWKMCVDPWTHVYTSACMHIWLLIIIIIIIIPYV